MLRRLCFLLSLLLLSISSQAQLLGVGRRAQPGDVPPKALLIELLTRPAQRDYLVKNRPDLLGEFDKDVTEVTQRTVYDWSTFFKFCPVYFFLDTNADKIRRGEFAGVLLDSTMHPAPASVLNAAERNFYIGYFGTPIPQPDTVRAVMPGTSGGPYMEHDGDDVTSLLRERFIVNDANFLMLSERLPRTNYVRALRPSWMGTNEYRRYRRAITYNARRWFIDYQPTAFSYDATLRRFFRAEKKETDTP